MVLKNVCSVLIIVLLSTLTLSSCSDDDNVYNNDYIEVTIKGKTYSEKLSSHYSLNTCYDGLCLTGGVEDLGGGYEVDLSMYRYENLGKVLNCSTGSYRVTDLYGYYYDEHKNFDLVISLSNDEGFWISQKGTNNITSIKSVDGMVQIEGTFTATLCISMCYAPADDLTISGKYRLTIR